jgi:DNA polymerase-3 subunit epsilon
MGGETTKVHAADRPLVFIDTETTGLDPHKHEIIEVAAVRVTPWGERVASFEMKTRPLHLERAEPSALTINGYTAEKWKFAVDVTRALESFAWICTSTIAPIIVGHNPRFDLEFLRATFEREGVAWPTLHHHIIDTSTLAWPYAVAGYTDSLSLGPVCTMHDVSNEGAHGAMTDVVRCMAVYTKMVPWRARDRVPAEHRDPWMARK